MDAIRQKVEAEDAGREAGRSGIAAGLNPHPDGSVLAEAWERGRSIENAKKLAASRRALVAPCRYVRGAECNCEGRGLCLDVA